jgi:cell division protein FtsB
MALALIGLATFKSATTALSPGIAKAASSEFSALCLPPPPSAGRRPGPFNQERAAIMTNVIQFEQVHKQELSYQCSKCGAERGCDCNAPAIKRAAAALAANPQKSDRLLASEAGVSHPTMAKARRTAVATGKAFPVEKRTGADGRGRKQPAQRTRSSPAPKSQQKKLAAYKRRITELEAENKRLQQSIREGEQERADICREFADLKLMSKTLEAENAKLAAENETLKSVAKNSAEIAVRATGGTVDDTVEGAIPKEAASVSDFVRQQWGRVVGSNGLHPEPPRDHTDDGIPGFLRRDKSRGAS